MTESKKRKSHSPEFKAKVGLQALDGLNTINQIAQEHGVHSVQVGNGNERSKAKAANRIRANRSTSGNIWHLDGMVITINGEKHWIC